MAGRRRKTEQRASEQANGEEKIEKIMTKEIAYDYYLS
jgi:hypothetical protein